MGSMALAAFVCVHLLLIGVPGAMAHPGQSAPGTDEFWAFRTPEVVAPPTVEDEEWVRTEVDRFVLARLEAEKMAPAPRADKLTLLRRVCFDLTGLPPTPEQIEAFLADDQEGAFSRLVDRLLESPAYGERWGRHWMDVARYADTTGDATDMPIPEAYLYRDYIIRSFNDDLPYDQFLIEQLAGDQLNKAEPGSDRWEDRVVATGFVAMAQRFGNSKFADMHLIIENTLDTVGQGMLGMSLTCARCHNHKFDPITMTDYYGLYGYFEGTQYPHAGTEHARYRENMVPLEQDPAKAKARREWGERFAKLSGDLRNAEKAVSKKQGEPEKAKQRVKELKRQLAEHEKVKPEGEARMAWAVLDGKSTGDSCMQKAGDPGSKGEKVARGYLRAITAENAPVQEGLSGRLELARWIASKQNPLTKRVMVNRIWQYHFGRGLVPTASLFGSQGELPSHPQLLDWLGEYFVENGWSIKQMHRLILNSATWQQSAISSGDALQRDPGNRLFGRWERRRLEGEAIRDAMLMTSGLLDGTPGGAHPFPADAFKKYSQGNPYRKDISNHKRTVYQMIRRNGKDAYWELFDAPDRNQSTSSRRVSTVPMQALFMMNSEFVRKNAEAFAKRLDGERDPDKVRAAFELAYGRPATDSEVETSISYLTEFSGGGEIGGEAWLSFCRTLMASNEFIYLD